MARVREYATRSHWSALDRLWAVCAVLIVIWFAVPTRLFLQPVALQVHGTRVSFDRIVPWGPVRAYWSTELRSEAGDCFAPHQRRLTPYQDSAPEAGGVVSVSYDLDALLLPCLPPDGRFVIEQTHQVMAGGLLPLRPSSAVWSCVADGTPCARLR